MLNTIMAQIIEAMHVVGMGMGIDHPVQFVPTPASRQLCSQVRRRVDQYARDAVVVFAFDQQGTAACACSWGWSGRNRPS